MIWALLAVGGVTAGTLGIGSWAVRYARTTSDLFVASRAVTPWWNAAAISGEYLSAASFLGIAGLQLKYGSSALWQPLGFTAGYLALLLFVAAPLRRFGSYTIPDFAEARLGGRALRVAAGTAVLVIGGFYLVPQLKGAGLALREVSGAPYWVGVVAVGAIVAINVCAGGMRGITYVQAFQYWVKVVAISLPAILLLVHLGGLPARAALFGRELPRAPAAGLTVHLDDPRTVTFPRATAFTAGGRPGRAAEGQVIRLPAGDLRLPPGAAVPVAKGIRAQPGRTWSRPVREDGRGRPLLVYSLLIATFLGTMGLPHVLVRFYTNPDGPAARRAAVRVIGLLGLFYLFPAVYGLLGRALVPGLYVTGETDAVVLRLPEAAWPGLGGELLTAVVAAGAFAAFLSTSSGLLVSVAGTVSHDLWGRDDPLARRRRFRIAAAACMLAPAGLALLARPVDISVLVGWAFALAASTFCPLLLLGIWWTRLTAAGALAGMALGGGLATAAILTGLLTGASASTAAGALLAQPAVVTVPLAFAAMTGVSLARRRPAPPRADVALMRALHAPEGLGIPGRADAFP